MASLLKTAAKNPKRTHVELQYNLMAKQSYDEMSIILSIAEEGFMKGHAS